MDSTAILCMSITSNLPTVLKELAVDSTAILCMSITSNLPTVLKNCPLRHVYLVYIDLVH